jgi:hypothetical protein
LGRMALGRRPEYRNRMRVRYTGGMSTRDQLLYSALHGTAMRFAAERRNLANAISELRELAGGRDDILAEAAGVTVGSWYAWPSTHPGYELVAAGMLIMASGHEGKPLDYQALERWTRVGYERGMRFRKAER